MHSGLSFALNISCCGFACSDLPRRTGDTRYRREGLRQAPQWSFRSVMNVKDSVTMRRALHIGLFIGTLIGMSACASIQQDDSGRSGAYGTIEAGRTG